MALPALMADGPDVVVVRGLAPVLDMAGLPGCVIPLDRGPRGFARAVVQLRRGGYGRGVLLSASFSAAWLFRCGGVGELRGTHTDGRGWLLSEKIDPRELRGRPRGEALRLVVGAGRATQDAPPSLSPPQDRLSLWRSRLGRAGGAEPAPLIAVFPGANAPARRWPVERFAQVAESMTRWGWGSVVVLGGPRERDLTALVAGSTQGVVDLGGRTDLVDLAAVLSLCDLVITNDTGPMHLAGAVGTPTVSLWGSSDAREVRQTGSEDIRVAGVDLPCKPCYRNRCRRQGPGTILTEAHEECMRLICAEDVLGAVETALARRSASE